jgi:membrane protease YdiL (CAAX protease family)
MQIENPDTTAPPRDPSLPSTPVQQHSPIAPWWHTALLVLLIVATSFLGSKQQGAGLTTHGHVRLYSFTIAWEWLLAGFTLWGIRLRKTSLRQLLGERRRGLNAWLADLGAAMIFWIVTMMMLASIGTVLRLAHHEPANQTIVKLAPRSATEMLLWIALSVSAGICEELVFRGYLQQQFASVKGKIWIGVLCSAVLFGGAHAYEGVGGMIAITAFGEVLSLLVLRRRNLRPSMMMHAWHDIFSGAALFILAHARLP